MQCCILLTHNPTFAFVLPTKVRSQVVNYIRSFLDERGFLEVRWNRNSRVLVRRPMARVIW